MNYRVMIVGPAGSVQYLSRGRECGTGTFYSSPSAANRAWASYQKTPRFQCWKVKPLGFVINKDGEYV